MRRAWQGNYIYKHAKHTKQVINFHIPSRKKAEGRNERQHKFSVHSYTACVNPVFIPLLQCGFCVGLDAKVASYMLKNFTPFSFHLMVGSFGKSAFTPYLSSE